MAEKMTDINACWRTRGMAVKLTDKDAVKVLVAQGVIVEFHGKRYAGIVKKRY